MAAKDAGDTSTTPEPITIVNSTIAANSVTGVAPAGTGDFGGGLSGDNVAPGGPFNSNLIARNSIIARNTVDGAAADCALTNTTSSDHNLSSDSSCGFTDAGSIRNADPKLGPLADNGGPTDTLALQTGSPAIDAGDNAVCPATDQIGTARPQNVVCDIGAFELVPSADLAVTNVAAPGRVIAGHDVTYTATVRNNGPNAANLVTLTDTIGPGQIVVSAIASQGTCTGVAPIACSLGGLASGASATVTVVGRSSAALGATGRTRATTLISDTATAASAAPDPNSANNSATASATVLAATPPRITVTNTSRRGRSGCVAAALTLPVRITSATALRRVRVTLNGRTILTTTKGAFTLRVPSNRLRPGRNVIVVTATNASGHARTSRITVTRCAAKVNPRRPRPRPRPLPARHPHFTG